MRTEKFPLTPPSLEELASALRDPLAANYTTSSVSVAPCPDLRAAPFHLKTRGLGGDEKAADVGGQPNLFPTPRLHDTKWSLTGLARAMDMSPEQGSLIGAGAGPFHVVGRNSELCPDIAWRGGFDRADNGSRFASISPDDAHGRARLAPCPSAECALMINLFGSRGEPGPVLKITAKGRRRRRRRGSGSGEGEGEGQEEGEGERSFTECVRKGLRAAYGDGRCVSLGGVFHMRKGRARYHVMPDFPAQSELPFRDRHQLNDWLTYHEMPGPATCTTLLHSADPGGEMGLRMEHTHGFSTGEGAEMNGGHYHYDVEEDVEYEAYFNTAKELYRIERPEVALECDLHDE